MKHFLDFLGGRWISQRVDYREKLVQINYRKGTPKIVKGVTYFCLRILPSLIGFSAPRFSRWISFCLPTSRVFTHLVIKQCLIFQITKRANISRDQN